jgi:hypothetical protein
MAGFLIPESQVATERQNAANAVAKMGDYFTRLQLFSSKSKAVTKKLVAAGEYALQNSKDDITPLGDEITVLVIAARAKALDTSEGQAITIFELEDPEFERIKETSFIKDSKCMYGPEYLVWIEGFGYSTFFMGTKSLRRVSGQMQSRIGKAALLKSKVVDQEDYSWEVPIIGDSLVDPPIPDLAELETTRTRFLNEKSTKVAPAAKPGTERAR